MEGSRFLAYVLCDPIPHFRGSLCHYEEKSPSDIAEGSMSRSHASRLLQLHHPPHQILGLIFQRVFPVADLDKNISESCLRCTQAGNLLS